MGGTLYLISTPIGNLEDITFRAVRILKESSVIAAEDTRHTQKLCNYYQIHTPLTSYHDFNKEEKTPILLHRLHEGYPVSLVCDAGTPLISDPGFYLVRRAIVENIVVTAIPGPSSILTALCASGLPTDQFRFEGFIPKKPGAREKLFHALKEQPGTIIFFDNPHRLEKTLTALHAILGNRNIVIARELTKLNEEFIRGSLDDIIPVLAQRRIKGEITILVQGVSGKKKKEGSSAPFHPISLPLSE
jgi:16S rRNA (cytidine1402-2'-O)-methyltransferase